MNSLSTVALTFVFARSKPYFLCSSLRSSVNTAFLVSIILPRIFAVSPPEICVSFNSFSKSLSFDFYSRFVKSSVAMPSLASTA